MKKTAILAMFAAIFLLFSSKAEAQLFKRLKSEVVGMANQKADQKALNTTSQTIDGADTLLHRGIRSIFSPKKKDKDNPANDPNQQPQATQTGVPVTDTTHHRP